MNWDAIGAVGEIVGALAVVATLVYLSIQIRENSKQVRVSSITSMNHLLNEAFDPIYNNDRNISIWTTGISQSSELDEEDLTVFSLLMSRIVNVYLTAIYQEKSEVLESEEFERYITSLKMILDTPGGKVWLSELGGNDILTLKAKTILETAEPNKIYVGAKHN